MAKPPAQTEAHLQNAFRAEELYGLKLSFRVRLVALSVIAVWLVLENPGIQVTYFLASLALFAGLGLAPLLARQNGIAADWVSYVFPALDMALLAFVIAYPNPFEARNYPLPLALRQDNEVYFFVLLTSVLFTHAPRVVLWSGISASVAWGAATVWIATRPGSWGAFTIPGFDSMTIEEQIFASLDPYFVSYTSLAKQIIIFLLVSGGLAVSVWRSRRLVAAQARTERERASLARYFSPNIVNELAGIEEPLREERVQDIAIMFVDIVGFTRMSEALNPKDVISLLRNFDRRLSHEVFAHRGTLEKFMGDGLMVTFGTPHPGEDDASRAAACAKSIVANIEQWNHERTAAGHSPIRVSVGAHFGPAVLGDVGDENRLEFAVLGDSVNVAARLETITRALGVNAVISEALAVRAKTESGKAALEGWQPAPPQALEGRQGRVPVRTLGQASAPILV